MAEAPIEDSALARQTEKYVAEVRRVEQMIATQERERRWQKWWILGGVIVGGGLYFVKPLLGAGAFATGLFLFATGMYLTTIHIYESRGQLRLVQAELDQLQTRSSL